MEVWLKILIPLAIISPIGWLLDKYWENILTFFKRQKLKFFPAKFNIGISFDYVKDEKSGDYFAEIKKQLENIIDNQGLTKQIKVHDFSNEKKFTNKSEAEKFRSKKNIDLIIWGNFSNKNMKSKGKEICSLRINFTYGHPDDKDNKIGKFLLMDITSKMAYKNYWRILEDSSYEDTIKITNNIFDIGAYIIARALHLWGKFLSASTLLERIYTKNNSDADFQKQLIPHIIDVYIPIIIDLGVINKRYADAEKYCEKMLKLIPNNFFGLSNLAVFQYKSGKEEESEKTVENLLKLYPNDPLTNANVAFFRLVQGKYNNALKHYYKLTKYKPKQLTFNPLDIVEFLSLEFEKRKDPAFLFASGIISHYLVGDEKLSKKDLKQFIKLANPQKYKKMYSWAKKIIS
jgi:tetratricopeptide (TPR) repeat protein